MNINEVIDIIKHINEGSAGCSLRIQIAAYNLLEYIIQNEDYRRIIKLIYKYYTKEYDNSDADAIIELQNLLSLCCTLLLNGKKYSLEDIGLKSKKYEDNDIIKFIKFTDLINEKYKYELKLDSINDLRLQQLSLIQQKIEYSLNNVNDKINNASQRIDKIHFDTISIISVFVAIIFTLYGGTQLVSSVIDKINKHNYRLIINTGIIMGYILLILTSVLLSTLSSNCKKNIKGWIIVILNVIYSIVVIVALCTGC